MATVDEHHKLLVKAYAQQHASTAAALIRVLLGIWMPLNWLGRPDLINAAAAASAVQVDIANARTRRIARSFMLRQLALIDATPPALPDIVDTYERGGTPIVEVYKRPARQVEYEVRKAIKKATGQTQVPPIELPDVITDDMMKTFEERLTTIVEDDLASTARDEQQKVMWAAPKVIGYRRVIHPEFSETGTCGLCVVASSRFYTKSELMPMHGTCKCTVSPITANQDLGLKLNREDLDKIYEAAGSNYAEDLKRITVEINEHGELGPILTRKGHNFRDVDQVNRDSTRHEFTAFQRMTEADNRAMWEKNRHASERSIKVLEAAKRAGTSEVDIAGNGRLTTIRDIDKAIDYHRRLIARAISYGAN